MTPSKACLALIQRHEDALGFLTGRCTHLKAYKCPAGVWTCGWGTTRGVTETTEFTQDEADRRLTEDATIEAGILTRLVKVPLTQGQLDALTSLAYNLRGGAAALPKKAPRLWAKLHAGDPTAADEFLDMDRATKPDGTRVVLPGLTRRRREERAMFLGEPCEKS
jgi:lysozyme